MTEITRITSGISRFPRIYPLLIREKKTKAVYSWTGIVNPSRAELFPARKSTVNHPTQKYSWPGRV
jgi:hypothetical protein